MDKRPLQIAVALFAFPLLYFLYGWWRDGEFWPGVSLWTPRLLVLGGIVLAACWCAPLRPGQRAGAYVAGMTVLGVLYQLWINLPLLSRPGFGRAWMTKIAWHSLPHFLIPAILTGLLVWGLSQRRGWPASRETGGLG